MSVPVVPTRCQCVRRCMSVSPVDPISWDLPSLWSLNTLQYKSLSHTLFVWVCAPLIIPSDNVEYSDRAQCCKTEWKLYLPTRKILRCVQTWDPGSRSANLSWAGVSNQLRGIWGGHTHVASHHYPHPLHSPKASRLTLRSLLFN